MCYRPVYIKIKKKWKALLILYWKKYLILIYQFKFWYSEFLKNIFCVWFKILIEIEKLNITISCVNQNVYSRFEKFYFMYLFICSIKWYTSMLYCRQLIILNLLISKFLPWVLCFLGFYLRIPEKSNNSINQQVLI